MLSWESLRKQMNKAKFLEWAKNEILDIMSNPARNMYNVDSVAYDSVQADKNREAIYSLIWVIEELEKQ